MDHAGLLRGLWCVTAGMADRVKVELGAVQETLFSAGCPGVGDAQEAADAPGPEGGRSSHRLTSTRTSTAAAGAVPSLSCAPRFSIAGSATSSRSIRAGQSRGSAPGLNTRFDRVGNGQAHWIDLDLPDTIELRRRFFADSGRRRMVAASVLDQGWLPAVRDSPGPVFLRGRRRACLPGTGSAGHRPHRREFSGALIAFDTLQPADARAAAPDGCQEEHGCAMGMVVRRPAHAGIRWP